MKVQPVSNFASIVRLVVLAGAVVCLVAPAMGQVGTTEGVYALPTEVGPGAGNETPPVSFEGSDCGCASTPCDCQPACSGGCRKRRCGGCGNRLCKRPCRQCPNCQADVCVLESKCGEEKRSCWKTEQKIICVPRVRFPWQQCDPPTCGKTRTITVLKKHSYKCPACKYTWKVREPDVPEVTSAEASTSATPNAGANPVATEYSTESSAVAQEAQPLQTVGPLTGNAPVVLSGLAPDVPEQPGFEPDTTQILYSDR